MGMRAFNRLYEGGQIQEAACWAHVRRKFFDLHQAHASPIASEALHASASCMGSRARFEDVRRMNGKQIRQARTRPLLDQMHDGCIRTSAKLSRKSAVAVAIQLCARSLGSAGALLR